MDNATVGSFVYFSRTRFVSVSCGLWIVFCRMHSAIRTVTNKSRMEEIKWLFVDRFILFRFVWNHLSFPMENAYSLRLKAVNKIFSLLLRCTLRIPSIEKKIWSRFFSSLQRFLDNKSVQWQRATKVTANEIESTNTEPHICITNRRIVA